MCNKDLRDEMRIANVRHWEVADAIGVSEMTMVKWLRKELDDDKKALVSLTREENKIIGINAELIIITIC